MLKFLNVPPKSGADVEFAERTTQSLRHIDSRSNDGEAHRETLEYAGSSAAKLLIDNMQKPKFIDLIQIGYELSAQPTISEKPSWCREAFMIGALKTAFSELKN